MQGKKHYNEKLFNSFQLSDRVPKDNFYRMLREQLDLRFLDKATREYYGSEGQKSIDPVVFFKLIMVGYFENLNSDRKIIEHTRMRMDILFFIGYDIDEELPWHSTLSRTRQLFGDSVFVSLFQQVLKLCIDKGMVGGKRQALDSAFIKANASMSSLVEKEVLDDAAAFSEELTINDDDKQKKTISYLKKRRVEQHHKWKQQNWGEQKKFSKALLEGDDKHKPQYTSNYTHYSTTDADARISVKPGKVRQLNYTAQAVVDTSHHVITCMQADYSDKKDSQSLPAVVAQAKTNLEKNGLQLEELIADAGYSSGTALKYLEEENITGYIPNFGLYKPSREGFIFNKEKDQYECQQGNKAILSYKKTVKDLQGYEKKSYRSSSKDCRNCPLRKACIGKSDFKKLENTIDKEYYDRMHLRMQSTKAKSMMRVRSSTVEPVLGTLINFTGMRRIWTRGIKNANKFMLSAAIAYNLKKYIKFITRKVNTRVVALEQTSILLQNAFWWLHYLLYNQRRFPYSGR